MKYVHETKRLDEEEEKRVVEWRNYGADSKEHRSLITSFVIQSRWRFQEDVVYPVIYCWTGKEGKEDIGKFQRKENIILDGNK